MMDANCLFECNMNLGKNLGMALLSSIVIHPAQLMAVNQVNKYADINETVSPLTHMFFCNGRLTAALAVWRDLKDI